MCPKIKEKFIVKAKEVNELDCSGSIGGNHDNIEYANNIAKEVEYHFYNPDRALLNLFISISKYFKPQFPCSNIPFDKISSYIGIHFMGYARFFVGGEDNYTLLNEGEVEDIRFAFKHRDVFWCHTEDHQLTQVLVYPFFRSNEYIGCSVTYFDQPISKKSIKIQIEFLMSRCELLVENHSRS